jgi:hypothetical protein
MSATSDFYLARAAESALQAEATNLDNVRDRWRQAEAAWLAMADKVLKSETKRSELALEKAQNADG